MAVLVQSVSIGLNIQPLLGFLYSVSQLSGLITGVHKLKDQQMLTFKEKVKVKVT